MENKTENALQEKAEASNAGGAAPKQVVQNAESTQPTAQQSVEASSAAAAEPLDNFYFNEDEIFRIDKKGHVKFGMVVETSETYDDEDTDLEDELARGQIRVAWYPNGKEEVVAENAVGLADRALMPGDVVRRLKPGRNAQRGYCREINMRADVKILATKYVIKNVVAERLRLMGTWQNDWAVCLDSWVGSTKEIEEKAVLKADNGALIEVSSGSFWAFDEIYSPKKRGIYDTQVFYPGNVVTSHLNSMRDIKLLTPDKPLPVNKKGKIHSSTFTIESVETENVWVHWQCKALSDESNVVTNMAEQPPSCVKGKDLERLKGLNLFDACMLQMSDRSYLKYSQCDTIISKKWWDKEQDAKFKFILSQQLKEDYQNFFSPNAVTNVNSKGKRKLSSLSSNDVDKPTKPKKFLFKLGKLSSSSMAEKTQNQETSNNKNSMSPKPINATPKKSEIDSGSVIDDNDIDSDDSKAINNDNYDSSASTMSTCSTPSPPNSPKRVSSHNKQRKSGKVKRSLRSYFQRNRFTPKIGDELVTEALLVYSTATVVWQDGSIEEGIPSTELYPIHHLDNHEFFPGDFVVSAKSSCDICLRDYGVIQTVDHFGRTAHVKWFKTYTSADEARPAYKGESEVSVYDLKDHPDFQYRPGTMVIRVANFVGEDATCTAGQIIDNYTDGRVKVWWVDGHISMCWPQDLFEVGQYDHTEWGQDSDDSWETESENSEIGDDSSHKIYTSGTQILSNMEYARLSIERLEDIFNLNPALQNVDVKQKLLAIYKACRFLDRLLKTNFFHESNFVGVIERVRKDDTMSMLSDDQTAAGNTDREQQNQTQHQQQELPPHRHCHAIIAVNSPAKLLTSISQNANKEYAPKVLFNISSTPFKCTNSNSSLATGAPSNAPFFHNKRKSFSAIDVPPSVSNLLHTKSVTVVNVGVTPFNTPENSEDSPEDLQDYLIDEKQDLLASAMHNIAKIFDKTGFLKTINSKCSQDDSGNYSPNEISNDSSTDLLLAADIRTKVNDNQESASNHSIELCEDVNTESVGARLCHLLNAQLKKFMASMRNKVAEIDNDGSDEVIDEDVDVLETTSELSKEVAEEIEAVASGTSLSTESNKITVDAPSEYFQILPMANVTHKYHLTMFSPSNPQPYFRAVQREHRMLKTSLPPGVWVKVFEDRTDLLSVMMEGPKHTPYEDGLFFFEIQLGRDYPKSPPLCHYISYCSDRLNPNLYEDGKVCVSLLGTWSGRDTEVWGKKSTLLQVLVSIQGLILVSEPYFNEAGYEKQKGTQQGNENSRMYNEMVLIKMVEATSRLLQSPPQIFRKEVEVFYKKHGVAMYERIKGWMELSDLTLSKQEENAAEGLPTAACSDAAISVTTPPEFPLVPASRGFCLTLASQLTKLKANLDILNSV